VSVVRPKHSTSLLLWFGLLAPPGVWVLQFLFGFGSVLSSCRSAGAMWGISVNGWTIAATAAAGAIALLAWAAAFTVFRGTREVEQDDAPPPGRVHFLAVVALTTTPLFFMIIVLSGIGATVLPDCRQS
jgi:hypothetical protein